MDEIEVIDLIKKTISEREQQIQETLMSGGLKDIEHFIYLQGELSAFYYIANAISDMGKNI